MAATFTVGQRLRFALVGAGCGILLGVFMAVVCNYVVRAEISFVHSMAIWGVGMAVIGFMKGPNAGGLVGAAIRRVARVDQ